MSWTPDLILVRWMKFHVEKAGIQVHNAGFAHDFRDPNLFCALLHQLEPHACTLLDPEAHATPDLVAAHAIKCASEFGVDSYISTNDLLHGNPRLLTGFAAQIFKIKCGLDRELEYQAFSTFINQKLGSDPDVRRLLPLNPMTNDLLFNVSDGIILSKLCNLLHPDMIDVHQVLSLSIVDSDDADEVHRGHVQCVELIKTKMINCHLEFDVHDVHAADIVDGSEGPIIDMLWVIIKPLLLAQINCANHPELLPIINEKRGYENTPTPTLNSSASSDHEIQSEDLLLLWLNHHLAASIAGASKPDVAVPSATALFHEPIADLASGLNDPLVFMVLLNQLGAFRNIKLPSTLGSLDMLELATLVSRGAVAVGTKIFTLPRDICTGCSRLTMCLLASIFLAKTGISVDSPETNTRLEDIAGERPEDDEDGEFTLQAPPKRQPPPKKAVTVPPAIVAAKHVAPPTPTPVSRPLPSSTPKRTKPLPRPQYRTPTAQSRNSFTGGGFTGTGSNVKNRHLNRNDKTAVKMNHDHLVSPEKLQVEVDDSCPNNNQKVAVVIVGDIECIDDLISAIVTVLERRGVSHSSIVIVRFDKLDPVYILVPAVKRVLLEAPAVRTVLAVGLNTGSVATNKRAAETMTSKLKLLAKKWPEISLKAFECSRGTGGDVARPSGPTLVVASKESDDVNKRMEAYAKINSSYKSNAGTPSKHVSKPIECSGTYEVYVDDDRSDGFLISGTQRDRKLKCVVGSNVSDEVTIIPAFVNATSLLETKALVHIYAESWANIVMESMKDPSCSGKTAVRNRLSQLSISVSPQKGVQPAAGTSSAGSLLDAARRTPLKKAESNPITQVDMVGLSVL
jgi:hypothetical protein